MLPAALQVVQDLQLCAGSASDVLLAVDGFTMPAGSPAGLLRDGDHVTLLSLKAQVGCWYGIVLFVKEHIPSAVQRTRSGPAVLLMYVSWSCPSAHGP